MDKTYKLAVDKADGSLGLYDEESGRVAAFPTLVDVIESAKLLNAGKVGFGHYVSNPAGSRWAVSREAL